MHYFAHFIEVISASVINTQMLAAREQGLIYSLLDLKTLNSSRAYTQLKLNSGLFEKKNILNVNLNGFF